MPLISQSIPNLINGISQQPAPLRLPSQGETQINAYPSVVEGLKRRPPFEFIAKLSSSNLSGSFVHTINRDTTEQYVVIITDGDLEIYDLDGNEETITFTAAKDYLDATDPSTSFQAITIADHTFIVNTSITTAMSTDKSTAFSGAGLVQVKQAVANSDYKIIIDGTEEASVTTSTSDLKTNKVATDLETELNTSLGAGWIVTRVGSTLEIVKDDGSDFELDVEDSQAGNSLKAAKDKVQRFADLPVVAPRDFVIEVAGDQSSTFDNYYVIFEPSDTDSNFGRGVWVETVKPDIPYKLDATTMPHVLIRQSDNTFTFETITWGERTAGDETTVADPSFVGNTLSDIIYFKNRLGFLSDENVIFSRAGSFYDFFAETVTTVLDSDPIDVAASSNKVSILRHAIPFDEDLLLFSDQAEFIMEGGDLFTPRSVSMTLKTGFGSSRSCKPINLGRNIYFTNNNGNFSQIREYYILDQTGSNDAIDITAHVPKYVPKNVYKIAASTNEDFMCFLSTERPNEMYTYKLFWQGEQKLQSAWSVWQLGNDCEILNVDFIESDMIAVIQRSDGVYLEKVDISPKRVDTGSTYLTHYDHRLTDETTGVSVSYNSGTDTTTWTLPYGVSGTMEVVTRYSASGLTEGQILPLTEQIGSTVKVSGDYSTQAVFIGEKFESRYQFSHQYLKQQSATPGSSQPILGKSRLQMRNWTLLYENTGYFRVDVTPVYRDTSSYVFSGKILGSGNNIIGNVTVEDGSFSFPIQSKNDQVSVEIISDSFLPFHLLSADWEGYYTIRSQRV